MTLLLLFGGSANVDVAAPACLASAAAVTPTSLVLVAPVATSAVASSGSHVLSVSISAASCAATAATAVPSLATSETELALPGEATASATTPVVAVSVSAVASAIAQPSEPVVAVSTSAPACEATASMASPDAAVVMPCDGAGAVASAYPAAPLVSIGDYLRAALHEVLAEQTVIEAELLTAAAANDSDAIDAAQNRASVCSLAVAELERAIEFDDIRGPYAEPPACAASASSTSPTVAVV